MDCRSFSEPFLSRLLPSRTVSSHSLAEPSARPKYCKTTNGTTPAALYIPVEVAELVVNSLDDPDYTKLWCNWRFASRSFKAAVESAFARHHLKHLSVRIVLDNPPSALYFRLYDVSEYDTFATFRVCRYGPHNDPGGSGGSGKPSWGMSEAMWERTTMRGWKKRWQSITPRWPFNMAVVELGKQQKFMELPALCINPADIAFQCDWRRLLTRFFTRTRSTTYKTKQISTSACSPALRRVRLVDETPALSTDRAQQGVERTVEQVQKVC